MGWEDEFLYNSKNGKLTFFCQKIVFLSILILKFLFEQEKKRFVDSGLGVWFDEQDIKWKKNLTWHSQ